MAMRFARRFASRARVPVFCATGHSGRRNAQRLRLNRHLRIVASPRNASVMIATGHFAPEMIMALRHVHDQMSSPFGILVWNSSGHDNIFRSSPVLHSQSEKVPAREIRSLYSKLLSGKQRSSLPFGPEENPQPWRGKGDHGQGGKGMMGGSPYGRPMAMTGEDLRDGLQLGSLSFSCGPFLPWLPPGLRLSVTLQGDVIQELTCKVPRLAGPEMDPIFARAVQQAVPLGEIEMARAKHHLRVVADLLFLLELDGYGQRTLVLAEQLQAGQPAAIINLQKTLLRTGFFHWATKGLGTLSEESIQGLGAISRACGQEEDARLHDPAYRSLGFTPVTHEQGDLASLCRQRLAEAIQAVELAGQAGPATREPGPALEGPRGALDNSGNHQDWRDLIEKFTPGMPWDVFASYIVGLDLDAALLTPADDYEEADLQQRNEEEDNDNGEHCHHHDDEDDDH